MIRPRPISAASRVASRREPRDRIIRKAQAGRTSASGRHCGRSLTGAPGVVDLVIDDVTHLTLLEPLAIGRAPGNALQDSDASVAPQHARITPGPDSARTPVLEDAGSRYG